MPGERRGYVPEHLTQETPPGLEDLPPGLEDIPEEPSEETPKLTVVVDNEADSEVTMESYGQDQWIEQGVVQSPFKYLEDHPMDESSRTEEEREPKRKKANAILQTFRKHPSFRWVAGALAGAIGLGVVESSRGPEYDQAMESTRTELSAEDLQAEAEAYRDLALDADVQYELTELIIEEIEKKEGVLIGEEEARWGRSEWGGGESGQYAEKLGNLELMFDHIHKYNPDILGAKTTPEARVANYDALSKLMGKEFMHSTLMWDFSKQVVEEAPRVLVEMEEKEAIAAYQKLFAELTRNVGLSFALEMTENLKKNFHESSALGQFVKESGMDDENIKDWMEKSGKNHVYFEQDTGQVSVMRTINPKEFPLLQAIQEEEVMIKLWSGPANGGKPEGVEYRSYAPPKSYRKTPDGVFPYEKSLHKTSWDWQFSWIQDSAPLRMTEDGKNVEYQDVDGRWYLATGEDAVFMSGTMKPFRNKGALYNRGSEKLYNEDGTKKLDKQGKQMVDRPKPFKIKDFLGDDGKLRETWGLNDFGPLSIQMYDPVRGRTAGILIHSSPTDNKPGEFLNYSHACIHMKAPDIEAMDQFLDRGTQIRISSITTGKNVRQ